MSSDPNPSNQPNGKPDGPGWYILSTLSSNGLSAGTLAPEYAASVADFTKRYSAPPMTDTPYKTKAEAQQAITDNFAPHGSTQAKASQASQAISSALPNLSGINGFVAKLGSGAMWMRIAEVALGVVLIAIGVAKMTNAVPIATKIAGMVK